MSKPDNELFELWKPVVNYVGFYEVSSFGSIRSLGGRRGSSVRILKQADMKGYSCVSLSVNMARRTKLVHRLVAEAFLDNPKLLTEVNHKDGDKKNNSVSNLEWIMHRDNIQHAIDNKLVDNQGERHGMHKLSESDVAYIREPSNESNHHLAMRFDVSEQTISDIKLGKSWKHIALNDAGELS